MTVHEWVGGNWATKGDVDTEKEREFPWIVMKFLLELTKKIVDNIDQ